MDKYDVSRLGRYIGLHAGVVILAAATWLGLHPVDSWKEIASPEVLIPLAAYIAGVIQKNPLDASRRRRGEDGPEDLGFLNRRR